MSFELSGYYKTVGESDLSQELDCVNNLQATKWRVNERILKVMDQCWNSGSKWEGLPAKDDVPLPAYPFSVEPSAMDEDQQLAFKEWKGKRAKIHEHNNVTLSKRYQVQKTINLAKEYLAYDEFYYQWQLDFRTRKYPRETFLSPQVADYGKALIEFAEGMPITCPDDATWLAIHGANQFGIDKVSLIDREMWALSNTQNALDVYENPYTCLWWQDADKPWAALAWCFEWAEYTIAVGEGREFITHLPCQADGSCNGIQHLSAMLLDEVGGKSVNLLPSDKPEDIYGDVATLATVTLQVEADKGNEVAKQLLEVGVCRTIAKRPVMIVPYSGTKHSCRDYVRQALMKKCNGSAPWGDNYTPAVLLATDHIWDAISGTITGARKVMDYITKIASEYGKYNVVMEWVTPTGFPVQQRYFKHKTRQVKVHFNDRVMKVDYDQEQAVVDTKRYKSSSSPNFVHSMDACALTLTVNKCKALGITEFAMIHDSYGTHSPQMPIMSQAIREAFVELYSGRDTLYELWADAKRKLPTDADLPLPPTKGNLNLQEVLCSKYFFA
jgi:DNA-directed RNA polymerase